MKKSIAVLTSILALGLAGCESTGSSASSDKMAGPTFLTADALEAAFKKGSPVCKWTTVDGKTGEDFYYKTASAYSGDADRNMGSETKQGKWKISGSAFYTNFGTGKKALGTWYKVAAAGKKTYDLYTSDGKKALTLKC